MAIEPLGSIMSLQTQMMKPQIETKVQQVENAETIQNTAAKPVDDTILTVSETTQKGLENQTDNEASGNNSDYAQSVEQNQEKIRKAVEKLNKNMNNSEAIFGIHEGTNRVTIKLVDKDTKKVIKELPPEKTLDMIAKVWEMAGLMVDEKR